MNEAQIAHALAELFDGIEAAVADITAEDLDRFESTVSTYEATADFFGNGVNPKLVEVTRSRIDLVRDLKKHIENAQAVKDARRIHDLADEIM